MLYPSSDLPFVRRMLHDQEQHCQGSFVYLGHSSAKHLPGTYCVISSPFMIVEKKQSRHKYKRLNKASLQQSVFRSLIDLPNSYLMVSSVVGFYSLRVFEGFTPRKDDTTMTTVKMGRSGGKGAEITPEVMMCLGTPGVSFVPFFLLSHFSLPLSFFLESLRRSSVFFKASQRLSSICPIFVCGLRKH